MQDSVRHRKRAKGNQRDHSGALVRVGPLMTIPAVLQYLGHEPGPVLASADLAAAQFTDADFEIPYIKAGRLLSRCVAVTGCRHFGLLVGEHAGPSSLGVAGFLLKSAPDVGTALRSLVRHLDLQDQGGMATLQIMGSTVLLGYAIHLHGVEAAEQICELSITIASNIMRSLCGKGWNPAEVHFATRQPRDLAPYRRIFRAPIRFNAGQCAVAFPIRWLDHRIASADALLYQHLEKQAAELHKLHSGDIVDSLCQLLRKSIPARQCTFTDIARQLHLHERTLNRRLQEEGTSFRELLDATRYEMARQLLAESTMPIARIAMTLDYTDASAFSRAFKRWSGTTPAQWRMHNEGSA